MVTKERLEEALEFYNQEYKKAMQKHEESIKRAIQTGYYMDMNGIYRHYNYIKYCEDMLLRLHSLKINSKETNVKVNGSK